MLDNGCSFLAPFEQVGADLAGASAGDHFGHAVANSADGLTIAIGAPYTGTNGSETGLVRVYRWLDNQWSLLGEDFTGAAEESFEVRRGANERWNVGCGARRTTKPTTTLVRRRFTGGQETPGPSLGPISMEKSQR